MQGNYVGVFSRRFSSKKKINTEKKALIFKKKWTKMKNFDFFLPTCHVSSVFILMKSRSLDDNTMVTKVANFHF